MQIRTRTAFFSTVPNSLMRCKVSPIAPKNFKLCAPKASAEDAKGIISGEWESSWSLATYDDVMTYFNRNMLKSTTTPSTRLSDIMQTSLRTCLPDESLDELQARDAFGNVSGLPVVRADGSLVGIISKGDLNKPGTHVHEVMSFPPVAARETDTVTKAACLMLKYKVHRIPVVNASRQCLGIVTRTDVFTALAVDDSSASAALNIDM